MATVASFAIGFLIGLVTVLIYIVLKEDLRDGKK